MKFILPLGLVVLFVIFQSSLASAATVSANFDIKDSSGAALSDVLVLVQGVSNPDFSESKLTDSNGKASFNVNQNELFVYVIYKLGFEEKTGTFLANSNRNFPISLAGLPDNQWFFYLFNNGELEFRFKSLDADTNYQAGEHMKKIFEVRNVNDKNIELLDDRGAFQVVDAETNKTLRSWGDFDLSGEADFRNIVLKKDGLIQITFSENTVEVCASNLRLTHGGLNIELSGGEILCIDGNQERNKIPAWILQQEYRFNVEKVYRIDGQEKSFAFTSQEFFISNPEWKPEIVSVPATNLNSGDAWTYQAQIKQFDPSFSPVLNLLNYRLVEAPTGMTVDQSGLVSWTPSTPGNYNVVLRAYHEYFIEDSVKIAFFDQNFTLNVAGDTENSVPVITSMPITNVNENSMYSYQVIATDADSDILNYSISGASWLSINQDTGLISGTAPAVVANTDFNIVVSVSDGKDNAEQTYILRVKDVAPVNSYPVIISSPATEMSENTSFAYQIIATDPDGDVLTYNLAAAPEWLSIDVGSGLVSGIAPELQSDENFEVSVNVTDGKGGSANQNFVLIVRNVVPESNNPPAITSVPVNSVNESASYSYHIIATDADGDILTYSLVQAPNWLSIDAHGIVSGTAPEVANDAQFTVSVRVSDGKSTASQFYILNVINIVQLPPPEENKAPSITSSPVLMASEGTNYSYQIIATDENNDTLTYSLAAAPQWLTINPNTGFISGITPEIAANTEFDIRLLVSDGAESVEQAYTLIITNTLRVTEKDHDIKVLPDPTTRFYEAIYLNQQPQTVTFDSAAALNGVQGQSLASQGNFGGLLSTSGLALLIVLNLSAMLLISLIKFY